MSFNRPLFLAASSASFLILAGTAHAALTADDLWAQWKEAGASAGLTVSAATEVKDGATLTLNGVSIKGAGGEGGLTISDMTLTEEDDGSVTIEPAAEIKLTPAGEGQSGGITITNEGLALSVAEGEVGLDYGFAADLLTVAFDIIGPAGLPPAEGAEPAMSNNAGSISLTTIEGGYATADGENQAVSLSMTAANLGYDIKTNDPSIGVSQNQIADIADVSMTGNFVLPATLALAALTTPEAFRQALTEGMAFDFTLEQGNSTSNLTQDGVFPMTVAINTQPGTTSLAGDINSIKMDATGEGLEMIFTSPMVPVPEVKLTSGPLVSSFLMPIVATETAGDYGLTLKLSQVSINEEAWSMFDPGKVFPRDAADLVIDVNGKAKIDVLALSAASEGGMTEVSPPQPETLNIPEISLKLAGASLLATGAFTFDNAGPQPVPVGTADVAVSGATKLLDGLVATGLMAEEDVAGARMMMGAFMTPGAEPDSLTSKIEAKADGQILVNGQRIQ